MKTRPIFTPPHLERIEVPKPADIDSLIEAQGITGDIAEVGIAIAGALLEAALQGQVVGIGTVADAIGEWLRGRQ